MSAADPFRGERGERGEAGPRGEVGPAGSSDPDGFEQQVAHVTAEALAANRLRLTDKRLLIIFLVLVLSFAGLFTVLDRQFEVFRTAVITECERQNATLDEFARAALTNPARPVRDRVETAERMQALRSNCPPD